MKYKRLVFFFITLVTSTLVGQVKPPSAEELEKRLREPVPKKTDKASQQVIANYLKVKGGESKIRNIRNIMFEGHMMEGKKEYKIVFWESEPTNIRVEHIEKLLGRERRIIYGFDGEEAWTYDLTKKHPFPKKIKESDVPRVIKQQSLSGPFIDWEKKGYVFRYEGKAKSKGRLAHLVKMFHPNGLTEYFYFDTKNFMITRHGWEEVVQGSIVDKDEFYTKYQKIDGIWMPEVIEFAIAEQTYGKFTIETIETNQTLESDFFKLPKVKETWVKQQ